MALLFPTGMRLWWKITVAVYLVAALGLSVYWMVTESGLVRILIEAQGGAIGGWLPKITMLVTLIILILPLAVLRFVLPVRVPPPEDPDAPNLMRWR